MRTFSKLHPDLRETRRPFHRGDLVSPIVVLEFCRAYGPVCPLREIYAFGYVSPSATHILPQQLVRSLEVLEALNLVKVSESGKPKSIAKLMRGLPKRRGVDWGNLWDQTLNSWSVETTQVLEDLRTYLGFSLSAAITMRQPDAMVIKPNLPHHRHEPTFDVMVLMPFRDDKRPVYEQAIKPACEASGLSCWRADDGPKPHEVLRDIWAGIRFAKVILADISHQNPNVLYELGIAHTIGAWPIIICDESTELPFDLRHLRCIVYSSTPEGVAELRNTLSERLRRAENA